MTERKVCPYCESEYGDDTDAEGNVYCDCDGAMIERQAARIADDELRIAGLQSAVREKNARIAELEAACGEGLASLNVWMNEFGDELCTVAYNAVERLEDYMRSVIDNDSNAR